jgi:uncharacterized protein YyaL (SSP411 family)
LGVTERGTFEHGASTLQLPQDPDDPDWWHSVRTRLADARSARPQPSRDDKVITAWNGLAIAALSDVGALLGESRYIEAARECADFIVATHLQDGRLYRSSRDGQPSTAWAVAEDYGDLAEGLLALCQATGSAVYLAHAETLLATAVAHFPDEDGGFFDTADDAEQLFTRPRDPSDNATPSGQSALAGAALTYFALSGEPQFRMVAESALAATAGLVKADPRFAGWTLAVAEAAVAGPLQVAVVGSGELATAMATAARRSPSPGLVVAQGAPDEPGMPLLADRPLVAGNSAAYLCRGFVCDRPATDLATLLAQLGATERRSAEL